MPLHQVREANFDKFEAGLLGKNGISLQFIKYFWNFLLK